MGIQVEFNPDLALRDFEEFKKGNRKREECLPEKIETGKIYDFLKQGQRNFYLDGEVPLLKTQGNAVLSRPLASILILEAVHFKEGKELIQKEGTKSLKYLKMTAYILKVMPELVKEIDLL